jgi:hypothetical protein
MGQVRERLGDVSPSGLRDIKSTGQSPSPIRHTPIHTNQGVH